MALSDYVTLHEPQSASSPPLSASHAAASPPPSVRTRHVPSPAGVRKGVDSVRFTTAAEPPTVGASVSVPLSGTAHLDDARAQGEAGAAGGAAAPGAPGAPGAPDAPRQGALRPPRPSSAQPRAATAAVPGGAAPTSGGKGSSPEPQPWVRHLSRPASAGRLRPSSAGRLRASGSVGTLRHRGAVAWGASPGVV